TGELVTLPSDGPISRSVRVDMDLRDVVLDAGKVFVTRFRSAELLEIASDGSILGRKAPQPSNVFTMTPDVAWRAAKKPNGGLVVVHELAATAPLVVVPAQPYYGTTASPISASGIFDGTTSTTLPIAQAVD